LVAQFFPRRAIGKSDSLWVNMELRHLRYFCTVVELGGFSPAARQLHVSQSAISEQVHDLEREIGVQLLHRTSREVRLTTHGEAFYGEAKNTLRAAASAVEMAQRSSRGEIGSLSIGFAGWGIDSLFPTTIQEFRRTFQGIQISLREMPSSAQIQALLRRSLDIGFTRPLQPDVVDALNSELLYLDPIVAALPRGQFPEVDRVSITALAREPVVLYERAASPQLFDMIVAIFHQAGFSPQIVNTASNWSGLLTLVEAGEGIALVPSALTYMRSNGVEFRPLNEATASIGLVMAWHKDNDKNGLKALVKLIQERHKK
jgi:DNA-binding transcriptional LysR family regulator